MSRHSHSKTSRYAFTLVELLLVVIIIAILVAIVTVAMNPNQKAAEKRNQNRRNDLTTIIEAINKYQTDHTGNLPVAITDVPGLIGSGPAEINLCADLVDKYLTNLPFDQTVPGGQWTDCNNYKTGYRIWKDTSDKITVDAPEAELGQEINLKQK